MKVSDIIHGRIVQAEYVRVDGDSFPASLGFESEIVLAPSDDKSLQLILGSQRWDVVPAGRRDQDITNALMAQSLHRVCWLVQRNPANGPAKSILIQINQFPSSFVWNEPVDIGVDDKVVEDVRHHRRSLESVDKVVEWLTKTILLESLPPGQGARAILSGAPAPEPTRKTAFRLYGAGFAVDVERGIGDRLRVSRIVESRRAIEGVDLRPVYLAKGPIRFCDSTVAGSFRGVARTELDTIVAQADSYLGLWKHYNEREREAIIRRARAFEWVAYSKREQLSNGSWRFQCQVEPEQARELRQRLNDLEDDLQADEEVPEVILGTDSPKTGEKSKKVFAGEVAHTQLSPLTIDLRPPAIHEDRIPPECGYLFVSLVGDEKRISRRSEAWERVRGCTNPMPQLGMLIEGRPVPERHSRALKPMTKAVTDLFPNPNEMQRIALEVALNTPDIALIQGPPGTGKTRVIAALQARLAERDEESDPSGLTGNTLLTSFQHDAVENAAAATKVLGLPAIKIGRRRGGEENRDGLEAWISETSLAVRATRAQTQDEDSIHRALRDVRTIVATYLVAPSPSDVPQDVLRQAKELAGPWLPSPLSAEVDGLMARLSVPEAPSLHEEDREFSLRAIRALRTDVISFGDDGPTCAQKVLTRLERLNPLAVTKEDRASLEAAASWPKDMSPSDDLLGKLLEVRNHLLDYLQPSVKSGAHPLHADVADILVRVSNALFEEASTSTPGVGMAVDQWLAALEHDPDGVREAVQHYSMVLAATCQQSVSEAMKEAKAGADTVFRTVVVDEAARSNPLDLLIPMARAERRIVLVGDHRQLPHILEPDIEEEIEQSVQAKTQEALKNSLFKKLFTELREREKRDGIKRTVTLNVQYRMHPLLGDFVSQQFYESHGEGFTSGRVASAFDHHVALKDGTSLKSIVGTWIDVPRHLGGERGGRSKSRPIEAARIAAEVGEVIRTNPALSVGVIAFYAAQRDEILAQMAPVGLSEPAESGVHVIRDNWRRTIDGRERLRVGTVDAFQGKEFDVVFLSLTRSNEERSDDESSRRRRYGFLLVENRLCVAMSRQHRLLVVVGDLALATGKEAEAFIPSLAAFAEFCKGPHGKIIRS